MDANLEANHRERRVVTVNEAALMLRISRGAAYEAAKRKEIPTIRIGRRLLVPLAALSDCLPSAALLPDPISERRGECHVIRLQAARVHARNRTVWTP